MNEPKPLPRGARFVMFAVGVLGLGFLFSCISMRVTSPWPLEWMEGASFEHALRLLRRQSIYAAPSGSFSAFVYPPLSYWPMALSAQSFGPNLFSARLPSLIALVVSLGMSYRFCKRATGEPLAGWLAMGLFALGYGYTGGFLDLARVDGLFIALVLVGLERLSARGIWGGLAALVLACWTKQHGILFLLTASLSLLLPSARREARANWLPLLVSWAALLISVAWLDHATQGWFLRYVLEVPRSHRLHTELLASFFLIDVCVYLPVLAGLCVYALLRRPRDWDVVELFVLAGLLAGALGRAHLGGDDNVRLPAYACLAVLGARTFCELVRTHERRLFRCFAYAALSLQALVLLQAPSLYAPSPHSAQAWQQLRAELDRCADHGMSVALDHTGLSGWPFVHTMALSDLAASTPQLAALAEHAIVTALHASDAPKAIAVSVSWPPLQAALARDYALCATLPGMHMPSGYAIGVTRVYRRVQVLP
jgi:4-amino-4-deoxy-L-arabinose transferase-like glycosyltransferase